MHMIMLLLVQSLLIVVFFHQATSVAECPEGCECTDKGVSSYWVRVKCAAAKKFPSPIPTNTEILDVTMMEGTGIPEGALQGVLGIRSLTIRGNVGPIRRTAFANMNPEPHQNKSSMNFIDADIVLIEPFAFRDVVGYKTISFSGSSVGNLQEYAFKYCSDIEVIRGINTSFRTFLKNSFYQLNRIGSIVFEMCSIEAVSDCAFCGLRSIGEIKFSKTSVENGFRGNAFNNIQDINEIQFSDLTLNLVGGFMSNVRGTKSNTSLVSIDNCYVPNIPRMAFHEVTNFNSFIIINSSVDNVGQFGFKGLRGVDQFIISSSHIGTIAPEGITDFEMIGSFSMSDLSVGSVLLKGISGMSNIAKMDFTRVTFGSLADLSFHNLDSIDALRFTRVTFEIVRRNAFKSLSNIGAVNFTETTFSQNLDDNTFSDWRGISVVSFDLCTFPSLNRLAFNNFLSIGWFGIDGSTFHTLETGSFYNFRCLNTFSLTECDVRQANSDVFQVFSDIETFQVIGNNMNNMEINTFGLLRNVIQLDIDPNENDFGVVPNIRVESKWDGTDSDPTLDCDVPPGTLGVDGLPSTTIEMRTTNQPGSTINPPPPEGFSIVYIIVIVVVVVVLVIIILIVVVCCRRRQNKEKTDQNMHTSMSALEVKGTQEKDSRTEGGLNPPSYQPPHIESSATPRMSAPHEYLVLQPPSPSGHVDDDDYLPMNGDQAQSGDGDTTQQNTYDYINPQNMLSTNHTSDVGLYTNVQSSAPPYESIDNYKAPPQNVYQALDNA